MYDIAIVGAGPAGATLARLAGTGCKVLILDKRELHRDPGDSTLVKCCGGLLAPDAQKVLAEMGLGLPRNVLVGPQLFVVRTIDLQKSLERYYQRFYINIDREKFDRWLVSMIPESVETRFGCMFKSCRSLDNGVEMKFTCEGREYKECAKVLVGADGAFSRVRGNVFPEAPMPVKYVAIQEWYHSERLLPYYSAIFDEEVTDFYSWTIPKEDMLIVGSALRSGDRVQEKFEILKRKLGSHGFVFNSCARREGTLILRPEAINQICIGKGRIALLGEAAGLISPSSAEGLSYAFRSAILFARSLRNGAECCIDHYSRAVSGLKANILAKNIKSPAMYDSRLRGVIMKSGIKSLKITE